MSPPFPSRRASPPSRQMAVLEAVTAGLCGRDVPASWRTEGLAMWRAVVRDIAAVAGTKVVTLATETPESHSPGNGDISVHPVGESDDPRRLWNDLVSASDAALVIAPECEGLLAELVASLPVNATSLNAHPDVIALCADKWALGERLIEAGVAMIPAQILDWNLPVKRDQPLVIKLRDGAGSSLVRRVANQADWNRVRDEYRANGDPPAIVQPHCAGQAVSIAGWFSAAGVDWLPVAEQHLSSDGTFAYLGGRVPARLSNATHEAVQQLAQHAASRLKGLRGYIGFDLVVTSDDPPECRLVEINPRLTTSYLGVSAWWPRSPWPDWLEDRPAAVDRGASRPEVVFTPAGIEPMGAKRCDNRISDG